MRAETEAAVAKATAELTSTFDKKISAYISMIRNPKDRLMQPPHVTGNEGVSVIPIYERIRSVAELRNQELNTADIRSYLNSFCTHGIGPDGGLPVFNTQDEDWNAKANLLVSRILRDCDYRIPRIHFNSWLQMAVRRLYVDGDLLCVSDDIITGPGKILSFETDQICSVSDEAQNFLRDGWTYKDLKGNIVPCLQTSGVLHDAFGKVMGYAVSNIRGQSETMYDNCTIFDTTQATLMYFYERSGQYRGNSPMVALLQTCADMKSIIASELKSAKAQATNTILVKEKSTMAQKMMSLGLSQQTATDATQGAAGQLLTPVQPQHYEMLEEDTGGSVVHMPADGSEFEHLKNERPSRGVSEFDQYTKISGGASLGLFNLFSTGTVSTSFSAARAELVLTFATFKMLQAYLQRSIIAWYFTKVIEHLQKTKQLDACPDNKVPCETYSLRWPIAPMLNVGAEVAAALEKIKGGLSSFEDEMGPDAPEIWKRLKRNVDYLKANGLDLVSFFETKSGLPLEDIQEEIKAGESTPPKK